MREGDVVEDFELPDQSGTTRSLSGLLSNGPVVLFFYPAAMTAGCTKQACHFRDIGADYAAAGVQRVGISPDDVSRQQRFADAHSLDYPLLADTEGTVADIFGVRRSGLRARLAPVKRWTFAIDTDRTVVKIVHSEVDMNVHADEALKAFSPVPD